MRWKRSLRPARPQRRTQARGSNPSEGYGCSRVVPRKKISLSSDDQRRTSTHLSGKTLRRTKPTRDRRSKSVARGRGGERALADRRSWIWGSHDSSRIEPSSPPATKNPAPLLGKDRSIHPQGHDHLKPLPDICVANSVRGCSGRPA